MAGKIAELKFEAPLARFEEEDTASLKNMNLLTGAREITRVGIAFVPSCSIRDAFRCVVLRTLVNLVADRKFTAIFPNRKICPNYECNSSLSKLRI